MNPEQLRLPKFNLADAQKAGDTWGANCGPGALAAITLRTLDEVHPHLDGFDQKHYTNPKMMYAALKSLGVEYRDVEGWPEWGLLRVQWEGPWMNPGVPLRARYRHTHWVGCQRIDRITFCGLFIFDINAMCVAGWLPFEEWDQQLVPWLCKQCEPKWNGKYSITHSIEVCP